MIEQIVIGVLSVSLLGCLFYVILLRRARETLVHDERLARDNIQELRSRLRGVENRNGQEHVRCKGCKGLRPISECIREGENVWTCEDCRPKFCTYCGAAECTNCGLCTRPCKMVEGLEGCDCDDSQEG